MIKAINELREKIAWRIYPYTSLERAFSAQLNVDQAIIRAEHQALKNELSSEDLREIGEANHEFRETLSGRFEPIQPKYNAVSKVAATAILTAVGGAALRMATEDDTEDDHDD